MLNKIMPQHSTHNIGQDAMDKLRRVLCTYLRNLLVFSNH